MCLCHSITPAFLSLCCVKNVQLFSLVKRPDVNYLKIKLKIHLLIELKIYAHDPLLTIQSFEHFV